MSIFDKIDAAKKTYEVSELATFNPKATHIMLGPTAYAEACVAGRAIWGGIIGAMDGPGNLNSIQGLKVIRVAMEMCLAGTTTDLPEPIPDSITLPCPACGEPYVNDGINTACPKHQTSI